MGPNRIGTEDSVLSAEDERVRPDCANQTRRRYPIDPLVRFCRLRLSRT